MAKIVYKYCSVILASIVLFLQLLPDVALAASYKKLAGQGYKTGKLVKNRAGVSGWYVTNGKIRYFCKMKGGVFQVGKTGLIAHSSAGRVVKLDRRAFEDNLKRPATGLTQYSDAKAGRITPYDVKGCNKLR